MKKKSKIKQIILQFFNVSDNAELSDKSTGKARDLSKVSANEQPDSDEIDNADRLRVLRKNTLIPGKWRAEHGGRYYAVNNCGVTSLFRDDYYGFDDDCYRSGNYFRTLDEAEIYAEKWRNLFN